MIRLLSVVLLASIWMMAIAGPTNYVTDSFTITMRTGQGTQFQIVRTLPSGTPVEVLEVADDGYARVRTQDGTQGWVLSRFLVDAPVARDLLADAQAQLEKLTTENQTLAEEKAALEKKQNETQTGLTEANKERQQAQNELAELSKLAAAPKKLKEDNDMLRKRIASLESETKRLQEKSTTLQRGAERAWFLTGAGVLLGGFLLGLIIPRIRWRRRSSWDTF